MGPLVSTGATEVMTEIGGPQGLVPLYSDRPRIATCLVIDRTAPIAFGYTMVVEEASMEEIKRISEKQAAIQSRREGSRDVRYIHPFAVESLLPELVDKLNEVVDRVNELGIDRVADLTKALEQVRDLSCTVEGPHGPKECARCEAILALVAATIAQASYPSKEISSGIEM